jgi:tetratricopeptide (TPR) repeat protein
VAYFAYRVLPLFCKIKRRVAWVFAAFLALFLLSAPASAQEAANPALQSRFDAAFQDMFADPGNLDVMFRYAKLATELGDFEAAIATLERMLIYNPDLPRVRLELGALYFKLGAYATAESYFASAAESDDVPAQVLERVKAYAAEIAKRESRHRYTGVLSGGLRYQTNANAGPSSADVLAGGFDAILEDEYLGKPGTNLFVAANVKHSFDLQTQQSDSWKTTGAAYLSRFDELSELNLATIEATTGPLLALYPEAIDGMTVRPFVLANFVMLDDEEYLYTFGGGLNLAKQYGSRGLVDGGYELRGRQFQNSTDNPEADERSGYEHRLRMRTLYSATDDIMLNAQFSAAFDDAEKDYNSNWELVASAGVSIQYAAPFELTEAPWRFSASASHSLTDFAAPDPAIDPGVTRSDQETRITLGNTIGLSADRSVTFQLQHTIADSNLPNFDFDNTMALISASWGFGNGGG